MELGKVLGRKMENGNKKKRNRKFNDLSGQKFNKLTVIQRGEDELLSNGNTQIRFLCRCDCGNKTLVRSTSLKSGSVKSCGCIRKELLKGKNLEDLTGLRFGRWLVKYRADDFIEKSGKKATMWCCECDCGVIKDVQAGSLKSGDSKSCGCLKYDILSKGGRDLIGITYGRWFVIGKGEPYVSPSGRQFRTWKCKCECGAERNVAEYALLSGKSVSCGCFRKERHLESITFHELSGMRFGSWTVIERAEDRFYPKGGRSQMWLCECICGKRHIVAGNILKSGGSKSCGCMNRPVSKAESYICEYLEKRQLNYTLNKSYNDLVGVNGGLLSYDFLVYDNKVPFSLIEYQGEHHFRPIKHFGGINQFIRQQEHDRLKREYAIKIGIPLVEILYKCDTYNKISNFLDTLL